jgi:phosphatidylglycerophosphate synthase
VDRDVRMVVLGLGELTHTVHERERLDERVELEGALESVVDLRPAFGGHDASIYDRHSMTVSTEKPASASVSDEARRAGRELVLEIVFRPLASAFVPVLRRARISPPAVVLANAGVGLVAALVLARGGLVVAAVLLQVKTLLDNMDGQLARATGRVTLAGRYLDTIADIVVNVAVFAALGYVTGETLLAAVSFVALTVVLAVDFNVSELYGQAHGTSVPEPSPTGSRAERVLASIYGALFAPMDRAVRAVSVSRFHGGRTYDRLTVTSLANLGLTTQLAVLGLCLLLGAPSAYLWFVLGCLAALVLLYLRAERQARAAIAS